MYGVGDVGPPRTPTPPPRAEDRSRGSLGDLKTESTGEHVGRSDANPLRFMTTDGSGQRVEARFPDEASLRGRTVARGAGAGALAGGGVAAAGVVGLGAVLLATGKGAAIGAAVGSIIPGAGTVVGGIVGGVVGGLVAAGVGAGIGAGIGALIGRLAAGGSDRDRAEKLIAGLVKEEKITADGAKRLKGMSNADLSALVSISKSEAGTSTKADRDAIRRVRLMTAATMGLEEAKRVKPLEVYRAEKLIDGLVSEKNITPADRGSLKRMDASDLGSLVSISVRETGGATEADRDDIRRAVLMAAARDRGEAELLKAELLKLKPPARAALGARNVIALGRYLRENRESLSEAMLRNQDRLRAHWRTMRDVVIQAARSGREVAPDRLEHWSKAAIRRANRLGMGESPNLKPPNHAALRARNVDALRLYLRENRDSLSRAVNRSSPRINEYERFMQDAVARDTRAGREVNKATLSPLSNEAVGHVNTFTDDALKKYQNKREAFETAAKSFIELAAEDASPEKMADAVIGLHESFEAMQAAKGTKVGGVDLFATFAAAFARAASRSSKLGISDRALGALRAVHDAGYAIGNRGDPAFRIYGGAVTSTVSATVDALASVYDAGRELRLAFKQGQKAWTPPPAILERVTNRLESRFRAMEQMQPTSNQKLERVEQKRDDEPELIE